MIEKIKAVNNPLTIIAIFAALAEVAGTVALATVDKSLQQTFVWFVMAFPTLIVIFFFATLNFNPKVLYAPSDFRNEENFLNTLLGARGLSSSLDEVAEQLEEAKAQILEQSAAQISAINDSERAALTKLLERIESRVATAREEAKAVVADVADAAYPTSTIQAKALNALSDHKGHSLAYIARRTGINVKATKRALDRLVTKGLIEFSPDSSGDETYRLGATMNLTIEDDIHTSAND
jgi:predicted transcriptional regulator